jgi:hypothetical protein
MRDDGTGGDAVAGDGIYSATITGRSSGTLIGFEIVSRRLANAVAGTFPSTALKPVALPSAEGYIRWDDPIPFGNFPHYHMWNSQASENRRSNPLEQHLPRRYPRVRQLPRGVQRRLPRQGQPLPRRRRQLRGHQP